MAPASSTVERPERRGYRPIRDYALLGDCHGSALVASDGSVDWCCLGRFDAEPALWRLLDAEQGGCFEISPVRPADSTRAYLPDTNVLQTLHRCADGTASVTDGMPVHRASADGDDMTLVAPGWLVRLVEGIEGHVDLRVRYRPPTAPFAAPGTPCRLYGDGGPAQGWPATDLRVRVEAGRRIRFVLASAAHDGSAIVARAEPLLAATLGFWRQWCARCAYSGRYAPAVRRSAMVLKALTYAPSGAIVAAPTTSLPEAPGGVRNWDYRFSWLRDSSFVLQALATLGYTGEARRFCEFLSSCCVRTLPELRILYAIDGGTELAERTLDHVDGYAGARPVRVGNAACNQRQTDIYGELADWALAYHALGQPVDETLRQMLCDTADFVRAHWREPDQGIWEMRGEPRQHVHGKAMAWVALDRALRLLGPNAAWQQARDDVLNEIVACGIDPAAKHLVQAFDLHDVDAALLMLPLLGLPLDDALLARTVVAVEARLREGDHVHRYRTPDGLPCGEGAFVICSFWLVDALLAVGRPDDARALFERLLVKSNDLGLYAEQIEPSSGAFLGNFPQAFTHLALINSAIHLELHEHGGAAALAGTHAERARRAISLLRPADAARGLPD